MKKYIFFSLALLWHFFCQNAYCQVDKISFPANGSVFQQNDSGQWSLSFGGSTRKESNLPAIRYTIYQMNSSGNFLPISGHTAVVINPTDTKTNISNRIIFSYSGILLNKGFYRIKIFSRRQFLLFGTKDYTKDLIEFGVGDVYFISGQSNAAGFNYPSGKLENLGLINNFPKTNGSDNATDATIPFINNHLTFSQLSRTYNLNGKYEWHNGWIDEDEPINRKRQFASIDGFPYKNSFVTFKNGTNRDTDPGWMYPNGMASWCWQPLGYKIATNSDPNISKTPNLFFNVAYPGALLESFSNNLADGQKMMQTMRLFGNIMGAKAVLWHQGEANAANDLTGSNTIPNYKSNLESVIDASRTVLGDNLTNPKLSWYVSQASRFSLNDVDITNKPGFSKVSLSGNNRAAANRSYTNSALRTQQASVVNINRRIYSGIDTDGIFNNSTIREPDLRLHFSGNTDLNNLANLWYDRIKANYLIGGVAPTPMVPINYVEKLSNTSYRLTVGKMDGVEYYWCKNDKGIVVGEYDGLTLTNTPEKNKYTFNNVSEGDILTCYIKDASGRFFACQPFLASDENAKFIQTPTDAITFANSGGIYNLKVTSQNLDWDVDSKPTWVSLNYNEDELNLIVTTNINSGSNSRSGNIVLKEVGGNVTKAINVFQSGSSSSSTPLTSLTPTNSSSQWAGYGTARFNGTNTVGGTMQVSGITYSQGIGTHANSSIVYNLNGQYQTFQGKVGRDDASDNIGWDGGKVIFSIKTNGNTVWTSSVHGHTTNAQNFSIPVSGINTLELIVNEHNDFNYSDWANWMDLFLINGGGGSCTNATPTNVSASPSSLSSSGGSSTLSATCAGGAVANWSTGATGSTTTINTTITQSYTVHCAGGSCLPSTPLSVTVTVPPASGCGVLTGTSVNIGTFTPAPGVSFPLIARFFGGNWYLTQKIHPTADHFMVRGSNMLTRGDVTLINSSYINLQSCFAWGVSGFDGLGTPTVSQFQTPTGFIVGYECNLPAGQCNAGNGTPFYYPSTNPPPPNCTSPANLVASWTYANSPGGIPKIGNNIENGAMAMGSVNYSSSFPGTGIGTHANSEIVYDLGANHPYTHFRSIVGKDNASMCGSWAGQEKIRFKLINNANGALIHQSPFLGNPSSGMPQTFDFTAAITGIRYIKLVVEDGGDEIYCDWANWARARLTCSASGRVAATDSLEHEFIQIVPNPNNGSFEVRVYLEEDSPLEISLVSPNGVVFESIKANGMKGDNIIPYHTKKTGSGRYLIRVSSKDKVQSTVVVIE